MLLIAHTDLKIITMLTENEHKNNVNAYPSLVENIWNKIEIIEILSFKLDKI